MNKLRKVRAIGSPYHGLCYNDIYELGPGPPYPKVATRYTGNTFGPAVPIVHPAAPGAGQLSQGSDRAWGQYIGHTRSINGADGGVGIGWNRWLYCDPLTDATWLMRFEHVDSAASLELQVWCDGIFGRFGRQYTNTPRLVQTFTWVPELPSWNVWGYTVENVVSELLWDGHRQLAISRDGSQVFVHLLVHPSGVAQDIYGPTSESGHYWGAITATAVCSIVQIDLSGSNAASEGGASITATIAKAMPYENTGGGAGGQVSGYVRDGSFYNHNSVLYKTEDGEVTRNYSFNVSSDNFSVSFGFWGYNWSNSGKVTPYGSGAECRIFAQNAIYYATYKDNGANNLFDQRWAGVDWQGNAVNIYGSQTAHTWEAPSSAFHEMPYTRKWVATFDPADPQGTFVVGDAVYQTTYTGTTYQRI